MCAILKFFKISIRTILKKAKNIYIISGGLAYRTVEVIKSICTSVIMKYTKQLRLLWTLLR